MDLKAGARLATAAMPDDGLLVAWPDGSTLYMGGRTGLYAIDAANLNVKYSAPLVYNSMAITPDGAYLYCAASAEVDIVSTSSFTIEGVIPSNTGTAPAFPIIIGN